MTQTETQTQTQCGPYRLSHWNFSLRNHALPILRHKTAPMVGGGRLQALVYDILPSTTAVFSYAIGPRKLSANEHFFSSFFSFSVDAQTVVSLLQTTQIKQGLSFIAANKVYTSRNKTAIFESRRNSLFYPGWMRLMFTCVLGS